MDQSVKDMHRAFLEEIRQRKAVLQAELTELDAVERYHWARLEGDGALSVSGPPPSGDRKLAFALNTTRHEAVKVALQRIGRPAKIPQILKILAENGYGVNLDRRILFNSIYTALNRHKDDLFRKTARGTWALREAKIDESQSDQLEERT